MASMLLLLLVGFPAVGTRVSTRRGGRALAKWTFAALGLLVVAAFVIASPRFGNRLADSYGYGHIAAQSLELLGVAIGMPIVLSAGVIHLTTGAGGRPGLIFLAGLVVSLCGFGAGIVLLAWLG